MNACAREYPITADDVASQIVVEARAVDSPDQGIQMITNHNNNVIEATLRMCPSGVAYAECGPFELDAAFRKHLDDYLGRMRYKSLVYNMM